MLIDSVESALEMGLRLADVAAELSMAAFADDDSRKSSSKSDGSLITEADLMIEDALRRYLTDSRPHDGFLGEERGHTGPTAQYWIIDPIDGTASFASGGIYWGTLIAFCSDGELVVGIVDQPVAGRRTWAASGSGAWRKEGGVDQPLRVTKRNWDSARALAIPADAPGPLAGRWSGLPPAVPNTDHPALQVASGECEIAVIFGPAWDLAAAAVIVAEASGRCSDLGGDARFDSGSMLYTNGQVHDRALEVLASLPP